jgi:2'-hydroxyisoflavone reductase
MSMAEMLHGIRSITTGPIQFTWVPVEFLQEHQVRPWSHMPTWIPDDPSSFVSVERAVGAGLRFRPLADTSRATLIYHESRPREARENLQAGLSRDREAEVLAAWHGR